MHAPNDYSRPAACVPSAPISFPLPYLNDLRARSPAGVFIYGNVLDGGEAQLQSLLYAKLVAVNNPMFDFLGCNYTEKNMCVLARRCRVCV